MKPGLFLPTILFFFLSSIYRIIHDSDQYEKRLREQQALRLESELKFLRSQINPHFLFNVLNGLVSMARKKSEHLESSLIELASLIRFMLYHSGKEKVLLSTEIEYLRSYIALQQMRFGEDITINLKISEVEQEWRIEPMLLIPFVENAFKYGIGNIPDPFINVCLEVKGKTLHFSIENKFNPDHDLVKDENSGIGLSNVKERLDLLYKDQYVLHMEDHDFKFLVNLKLDLHD
ncbi:histidine kinase [Reichenbachiella sp. MALMAid0571]|uniref:sensor histidine kinase n=1 Tax=Reichenbachiella sp. MALMAid0571 TaxID=3143939 RepID=UPI0032DE4F48